MSTPTAAPAAPTPGQQTSSPINTSTDKATSEILKTLPQDNKTLEATTDDVEDDGSDITAEETAAAKKAEVAAKKAYKLKVGGKDVEVDESELLKRAQMGYSADEKWQEASKMRKQMESLVELFQKDPYKALERMGHNVDDLAEKRIQQRIEEMRKSPEQLEKEKIQRELEEIKAEREKEKEHFRNKEMERMQNQYAVEIENDISSAFDSGSHNLPKSPYVVKRVADTLISAMEEGRRTGNPQLMNIKAGQVMEFVSQQIKQELADMYAASPDEVFETLIGKDRLTKYRKAKMKKTAAPTANKVKQTGTQELQSRIDGKKDAKQKVSAKEFFKKLGTGKV